MRFQGIVREAKQDLTWILSVLTLSGFLGLPSMITAQQVPDTSFKPAIENPAYPQGNGPVVLVDEGHFNFHTTDGRYGPFADILRRDGYIVEPLRSNFSRDSLNAGEILVIANALHESNQNDWSLPTPSAFSEQEIVAVRDWIRDGGSLFLVADHMPWPGATEEMASVFGVHLNNGFATDETGQTSPIFCRSGTPNQESVGSLADHPITNGRMITEKIDCIITGYHGSAFLADKNVQPLLIFESDWVSIMTTVAWEFSPETPRIPIKGWLQGAVLHFGKGCVAVFGEASMFTAQLSGPNRIPMGMNSPGAEQNPQFLLNVMHWLSGLLDNVVSAEPIDKLATTWGSIKYSR